MSDYPCCRQCANDTIYGDDVQISTFSMTSTDLTKNTIVYELSETPGVFQSQFKSASLLVVRHLPSALAMITKILRSFDKDVQLVEHPDSRNLWIKFIIAGIFALASEGIELKGYVATDNPFAIQRLLSFVLAIAAILMSGLTTYRDGWIAIKNRSLNINALMSVAVTGAIIIKQFPEAAMVMVLFNIAQALEDRSFTRARNAIKNLLTLAPERATVQSGDKWIEKDALQITIDDIVQVRPGERIALDGIIVHGQSTVNQAAITGESMPVEKGVGDMVYAGSINESGSFQFRVTALSDNSTLANIIHAVETAQNTRSPLQRFVDKFAKFYTPSIFIMATCVAIIPPLMGTGTPWTSSIYMGLVLLVTGCPCALVISTPITIISAMAAATRRGILIKGGIFLEQGRQIKQLALDKTGTITTGRPKLISYTDISDNHTSSLTLAYSIARRSDHPVSRAIAVKATADGLEALEVDEFTAIPGQGVSAVIDGQKLYLGNLRLLKQLDKDSPQLANTISDLEKDGSTVVALVGKDVYALFAVADTIKSNALEAIEELKKLGIKTIMLTGDNEHTARAIASQTNIEYRANLLPNDKLAIVEQLGKSGKVAMVGDGINDAPALAKADIGFAMAAAGTDTATFTADVAIMDDDLKKIASFIRLSKSTYNILMQNIVLALSIKAIFFILIFSGYATMWMAVFADVGTSLFVVANGLRAARAKF